MINMVSLPENVMELINDEKSVKILATKTPEGNIHAVRLGSVFSLDPDTIAFGAILMKRSSKNLEAMKEKKEKASVLACNENNSFEIICKVNTFLTSGILFDNLNASLKKIGMAARGVWTLEPLEVWNQSATYDAGKRVV